MPGPMSAPNGDRKLLTTERRPDSPIRTGKTAVKKGIIQHARKKKTSGTDEKGNN